MFAPRLSNLFCVFFGLMLLALPFAAKPALTIGGGILTLIAGIIVFQERARIKFPRTLVFVFGGIALLVLASAAWSPDPMSPVCGGLKIAILLASALLMILAVQAMALPDQRLYGTLPVAGGIAIIMIAGFHLSGFALQQWWLDGAHPTTSTMVNKATGSLMLLLPALCGILLSGPKHGLLWATVLVALSGLGLFLSESQSSALALAVFLCAAILPIRSGLMWKLLRALIVGGLIVAPWLANALFAFAPDIKAISWLSSASIPQRLEVWQAFATEIFKHPILGSGFNAAAHIQHLEIGEIYQRGIAFTHPHNMALQIWLEYGAVGAALAARLLAALLHRMEREPDLDIRRLYLCAFLPPFVVAQIGWGMWQTWWLVLMILIVVLTLLAARIMRAQKTPAIVAGV